jgi:hypothetical protein
MRWQLYLLGIGIVTFTVPEALPVTVSVDPSGQCANPAIGQAAASV